MTVAGKLVFALLSRSTPVAVACEVPQLFQDRSVAIWEPSAVASICVGRCARWRAALAVTQPLAGVVQTSTVACAPAADAVAVLDAAGLREVVVLGHSWGGYLALRLAVAAPERVAEIGRAHV